MFTPFRETSVRYCKSLLLRLYLKLFALRRTYGEEKKELWRVLTTQSSTCECISFTPFRGASQPARPDVFQHLVHCQALRAGQRTEWSDGRWIEGRLREAETDSATRCWPRAGRYPVTSDAGSSLVTSCTRFSRGFNFRNKGFYFFFLLGNPASLRAEKAHLPASSDAASLGEQ